MTGKGEIRMSARQVGPHEMTEREILKRKITLKRQAISLHWEEIRDLQARLFLLDLRDRLEAGIDREPSRELSAQVDSVTFLLESWGNSR